MEENLCPIKIDVHFQSNLEAGDIDGIFDQLIKSEGVPDSVKKDLFFLQSDQYQFFIDLYRELLMDEVNAMRTQNSYLQVHLVF